MSFYQSILESTRQDREEYKLKSGGLDYRKSSDRKLANKLLANSADAASNSLYGSKEGAKAAEAKGTFKVAPKDKVKKFRMMGDYAKRKGIPHSMTGRSLAVANSDRRLESAYDDIEYADQLINEYC